MLTTEACHCVLVRLAIVVSVLQFTLLITLQFLPYIIFPKNMLTTEACHFKVDACIYTKCISMHGNLCNVFIEKCFMDRIIIRRNWIFFLNG